MVSFIEHNRSEIPYFQFTHPLKKLYKNTNKTVTLLIKRNKKSLIKELENNKLLMQLIVKGTYSNLTAKEKLQLVGAINEYFDSNNREPIRAENEARFAGIDFDSTAKKCKCCGR